ncbi:hypothetical protein [Quadrisphaera setariae]|uniref:Lactococcin 972 family bacteriocin n=1 Tax=Quadrisphaera setariae TaxID=2593304 RepID=A0A5C8Z301_9ACTN|nr:hypothetical protein [Quadrisphaera setariae]TXR51551.1 hypothetical protein FMM08_22365 [Quadrisphaera setariae]
MWIKRIAAFLAIFTGAAVLGAGVAYASVSSNTTVFGPVNGYSYAHYSTFDNSKSRPYGIMTTYERNGKKWPSNWVSQRTEILKNNAVCSAGNDVQAPSTSSYTGGANFNSYCGSGLYSARGVSGVYNGGGTSYYYAGATQQFPY